jgi:predicted anti-sigma-YlaC factor YlaD
MQCQELLSHLDEYVDGETQSALCRALREHLAGCESCRVVVDNIRQTITLYRAGARVSFPPGLHERLCAIMRQQWAELHPLTKGIES